VAAPLAKGGLLKATGILGLVASSAAAAAAGGGRGGGGEGSSLAQPTPLPAPMPAAAAAAAAAATLPGAPQWSSREKAAAARAEEPVVEDLPLVFQERTLEERVSAAMRTERLSRECLKAVGKALFKEAQRRHGLVSDEWLLEMKAAMVAAWPAGSQ
jgi:hypothetical protein